MIYYHIEKTKEGICLHERGYDPAYNKKTESVFCQCNGYMGVRASYETRRLDEARGTFISGLYHRAGIHEVTELVNCPDVTEFRIRINGEAFYLDSCKLNAYDRMFHVRTGELISMVDFDLKNTEGIMMESQRFASHHNRKLFCHQVKFTCKNNILIEIETGVNGQMTNSGISHFDLIESRLYGADYMYAENHCDDGRKLTMMTVCAGMDGKALSGRYHLERRSIYGRYEQTLKAGESWTVNKFTWMEKEGHQGSDLKTALEAAVKTGYDGLREQHKQAFQQFWDMADIEIEGAAGEEEAAIAFAQYHLAGMAPWEDNTVSIGAKGLTGEGYKGHVFWDTEIFILPYFILLFPEAARNLLFYRYLGLEGAKKKAREYGYEGAMYPWQTDCGGEEETPLYAAIDIHTGKAGKIWSGIKEHHVTADIIHGLLNYEKATKDRDFMDKYGNEMILETAVFWYSRAVWNAKENRYEILDTIGPDEYTEHIDNNAYTNYLAYENVKAAKAVLDSWESGLIKSFRRNGWAEKWSHFLEHIYLPKPNHEKIIPQDDTFLQKKELHDIQKYRDSDNKQLILTEYSRSEVVDMQVLKQADVVMLINLMSDRFDAETVKQNVGFYEARTIHDSSLSQCAHAEAMVRAGEAEKGMNFFRKAMETDLCANSKDSVNGIHAASMGGILSCIYRGFAGLKIEEDAIILKPQLPPHWSKLRFCIYDRGKRKRITISGVKGEVYTEEL